MPPTSSSNSRKQLDDPDATGVNSTGANPGSEPPCKKADGDGNKVPQSASEAQEFAEQFADGISLGGRWGAASRPEHAPRRLRRSITPLPVVADLQTG